MRSLRYLPIAFIAGVHGFTLFAPYLALMVAIAHYVDRRRRRAPAAAVVRT